MLRIDRHYTRKSIDYIVKAVRPDRTDKSRFDIGLFLVCNRPNAISANYRWLAHRCRHMICQIISPDLEMLEIEVPSSIPLPLAHNIFKINTNFPKFQINTHFPWQRIYYQPNQPSLICPNVFEVIAIVPCLWIVNASESCHALPGL